MKITKKQLDKLIEQHVNKKIGSMLNEAADEKPKSKWTKYGDAVDDFINDTIDLCNDLIEDGEEALDEINTNSDSSDDNMKNYVSLRLAFIKQLRSRLAQKYEGLRRNT